jgi:subtilisin-like proprotein convertase family protein
MLGGVQSIKLNLDINHPRRGDLLITLRSPQNRTLTVLKSVAVKNSSPANLSAILNVNGFSSADPNGTWTLTIKDVYKTRAGTLLAAGMDITTR